MAWIPPTIWMTSRTWDDAEAAAERPVAEPVHLVSPPEAAAQPAQEVRSTHEILQELQPVIDIPELEHRIRMATLLDNWIYTHGFPPVVLRALLDSGVVWLAGPEFIARFRYAAGLYIDTAVLDIKTNCRVQYRGDLPEFALDRLETARNLGLKHFTVHSNEPLPVELLRKTDPVLIGWPATPLIRVLENRNCELSVLGLRGVVLAAWDFDKEIAIGGR